MERKRRKSEITEDKRACMTPSMLQTPVSGHKEQHSSHFEEWDANEVASFLSKNEFDEHALIFQGTIYKRLYSFICKRYISIPKPCLLVVFARKAFGYMVTCSPK